jgi:hypothetical protein
MRIRNAILAAGLAVISAPTFAALVSISGITGAWFNAVPPPPDTTIVNGSPLSTIRWGVPATPSGQSGYNFTSAGSVGFTVNPPPISAPGQLGTFEHLNFPIFPPFLQSVELQISADIVVDGTDEGIRTFVFDFTHDETPNGGPPGGPFTGTCPFGGANGTGININGCADSVTVTSNNTSETFTVNGVQYTLDILGFSQDGGSTITNQFLTIENEDNTAGLFADVRAATQQVPEPGSLALVGLAMLGVVGFLRRKSMR